MLQKLSVTGAFGALVLAVLGSGACSDPGSGVAASGSGSALSSGSTSGSGSSSSGSSSPSGSTTGSGASGSSGSVQSGGASGSLGASGSPRDGGSAGLSSGSHRPDAAASGSSSGSMLPKPDASSSGSSTHSGSSSGSASGNRCADPSLTWKTANKTSFQSYPACCLPGGDPNSPECSMYNGCKYIGIFSACGGMVETQQWVMSHNIVSVFPIGSLANHELCLRLGNNTIVVTVLDTCSDADCCGCCTQNRGTADALIDVEQYTDIRWGVNDGPIEWADLNTLSGCN